MKHVNVLYFSCMVIAMFCLLAVTPGQVSMEWYRTYNGTQSYNDAAYKVIISPQGTAYVMGSSIGQASGSDFRLVEYDQGGNVVSGYFYSNEGTEWPAAFTMDEAGAVYMTGSMYAPWPTSQVALTLKYDPIAGQFKWARTVDGSSYATAIAVDDSSNVYITGQRSCLFVAKISAEGWGQWIKGSVRCNAGIAITLDDAGNIYVAATGVTNAKDYVTIKYNNQGDSLWGAVYNYSSEEAPSAIALDHAGNVIVTGWSGVGGYNLEDFATVKYTNGGTELWVQRYNGGYHYPDLARDLVVDESNNIYVTGASISAYTTIKYSPAGDELWVRNHVSANGPTDMVLDGDGNIYVTGTVIAYGKTGFGTVKYNPAGDELWDHYYAYPESGGCTANSIAVDDSGNVYVAGSLSSTVGNWEDWLTIKLTQHNFGVTLKAFLQGPYNGTEMTTDLNTNGQLPLGQPFNTPPWNYAGTEQVAAIPNASVVDWVLVELRETPGGASTATGATTVATRAGFILKNGDIVSIDGISPLSFDITVTANLYAVVYHRNHLPVLSSGALLLNGATYGWDFTTGSGQAFGGTNAQGEIGTGVWGLFSGDGDANLQVNNADKNDVWKPQSGSSGYKAGDFSLDGQVDNVDKNDFWKVNSGRSAQLPSP